MTIQELQNFVAASDFSEATKAKIASILEKQPEVSEELFGQLREIMQGELDADFKEAGITDISSDAEMQKIDAAYVTKLDEIQNDLDKDMAFVESELNDLDEMRKQLTHVGDQIAAEDLRKSI